MSYCWFNSQEFLQKAKDNSGGEEKSAEYYLENKYVLKKNLNNKYKTLSKEEKEAKKKKKRIWKKYV